MRCTHQPDAEPAAPADRLRLTPEGMVWLGVAGVLVGVGWYKNLNLVLLLAYLMAGLLLVNGMLARAHARRMTADRDPLPPVFAGEEAAVRVTVRNDGLRPATVGVTDTVGGVASDWLVETVAPGDAVECTARRSFTARGIFPAPPLTVWSGYPFGFLRSERTVGLSAEQVVLPRPGTADPDGLRRWVLRRAGGDGRARRVLRRLTADQADVRGVRPYRTGDSIRAVHWRSSARRGELMVREYDAAPSPDLILVVEPWLPASPSDADRQRLEAALSLAVTVVSAWCKASGARVTVAVAGSDADVRTGPPTEAFAREAVAPLAGVTGAPSFDAIAPAAFGRSVASAARVLVSSRPDSPFAAALARATGKSFVDLDPTQTLPWYQPPPARPHPG